MCCFVAANDARAKINAAPTTINDSTTSSPISTLSIPANFVNRFVSAHRRWRQEQKTPIDARRVSIDWPVVDRVCYEGWHEWLPTSMTSANDSSSNRVKCLFNNSNNPSRRCSTLLIHEKPVARSDSAPPLLRHHKPPSSNTKRISSTKWRKRSVPLSVPSSRCASRSFVATRNRFRQWRSTTTSVIWCKSEKSRARMCSVPAVSVSDIEWDGTRKRMVFVIVGECGRDRCQCCIDQVDQKKECVKNLGDNIFGILIKSCDYCPSKDQCRQYWKSSQTQFESCVDGCDSKQICTRIGFCNASNLCAKMGVFQEECERVLNKFAQSSQEDLSQIEQHLPHTSVVVLPTVKQEEQQQVNEANATCILCEYMMKILSSYIHQHSTEEEIEASLTKVCQQMPHTLQAQCHDFVDNYGPVIIATLINRFDVGSVCRNLNLCTKQMTVNVSPLSRADVASCGVCDYVSTYVHFALKRDGSEKSLEEALKSVCVHLSSDQRSQCQTLVQLFGPHMRELQLNLGENFCQQLPMCQSQKEPAQPIVEKEDEIKRKIVNNLDETPQCTLCHYVITYLDAVLKNNKSEEAIAAALEKVCTILPSKRTLFSSVRLSTGFFLDKERAQCNEFIKTYGPVLAQLISDMADPDTVCRYLGVCQVLLPKEATTKMPPLIGAGTHDYIHLPIQNTPFTCTICQFVLTRMKQFIALNQTEEEILASLQESCDLFSVLNLKQQCKDFLQQYGPYLIQMVSSDVEPKVACQSIGICEKSQQGSVIINRAQSIAAPVSSSVNHGKCIFGMSYWCTSRQNAELCNVREKIADCLRRTHSCIISFSRLLSYVNARFGRKRIEISLFKSMRTYSHWWTHSFF